MNHVVVRGHYWGIGVGTSSSSILTRPIHTDYPIFHNSDNFLVGKQFNTDNATKLSFRKFNDARPPGFCTIGLNNIPLKLEISLGDSELYHMVSEIFPLTMYFPWSEPNGQRSRDEAHFLTHFVSSQRHDMKTWLSPTKLF
ncbi:hypothetical protein NPIL_406511 [Nephila pilipes]|uniref:Uncharacterized protein n=1 Tax=Nephila pilipes TaxID=299642 RepID=A0A8X6MVE7_NEPPI|nr:hypothetical protein NPIL_406511 [Nephila pilipes]